MSIRILHVVAAMNRGGIETWLMQVLRHIDRDRFQMDFLVHTDQPSAYDDEIRALGSQIIPCIDLAQPWKYAANFHSILREYGPYDVVHTHVHYFGGYVLRIAKQAGVPVRIAHTHTDTSSIEAKAKFWRHPYFNLMKLWINQYATIGLGSSIKAIASLFGSKCDHDFRFQVIEYGFDLTPFREKIDAEVVRTQFGLPIDAFVIGHVGRFVPVKNHTFILDIASEVLKKESKMYLLLIGDGPLRPEIEQKATKLGLQDRVIFTGVQSDIAAIMLGAMNVFLFPSLYEGLGNVRLEAQVSGLPCIVSDVVPEEGDVVKPLVRRISLSQPASAWAEVILTAPQIALETSQEEALEIMEESFFNIQNSLKKMEFIYMQKMNVGEIKTNDSSSLIPELPRRLYQG
jgi:glycosyltransferase involved in cell wall biosynthesis